MNKEVIYIEPEDDITDIISRLKSAKQKVVALVPPKKLGVLRSAVNTKLIAKSAKTADKAVVIVTTDPALIKMSVSAGIPVAKTLQSRPVMPTPEEMAPSTPDEEIIDETVDAAAAASVTQAAADSTPQSDTTSSTSSQPTPVEEITSDELDSADKAKKDKKSKSKNGKKSLPALEKYRKWIIAGAVGGVALIAFLVWAFVFAPAVDITVAIRATSDNFSQNVSLTTNVNSAQPTDGTFALEEQKLEDKSQTTFTATGKKDVGEKAKGTLEITVVLFQSTPGVTPSQTVPAGTTFTHTGLAYTTDRAVTFTYEKTDSRDCADGLLDGTGCAMSASVPVTATESGDKYNIPATSNWVSSLDGVTAKSKETFTGGTSKIVTIVQQSDVDKAKEKLASSNQTEGKSKLKDKLGDDLIAIDGSFKVNAGTPTSTPAVGAEVADNAEVKLEAVTTYTIYAVDKAQVSDYITAQTKDKLASDQKIYQVNSPFFENFYDAGNGSYTAKLKATIQTGPQVTEQTILEKSKGRKIGEVQTLLKSINGVSGVKIDRSFFWVGSVPNDENKITIEIKMEE